VYVFLISITAGVADRSCGGALLIALFSISRNTIQIVTAINGPSEKFSFIFLLVKPWRIQVRQATLQVPE
jgi:hypothetical protein